MPRVLRIINRFNLGGPTYNAAYLTKYLSPGYETLLVGGGKEEGEESSEFILKGLEIDYRIIPEMRRSIHPFNDLAAYRRIKGIIREFRPDIVHTHAAKAGALGRRAAFACKVPVTVHTFHGHVFHSYFGNLTTGIFKAIERRLAARSTAIIAISQKQKEELTSVHRIVMPGKVHVIPLGFDLQRFRERPDERRTAFRSRYLLSDDVVAIGIVGRLVPVKNHDMFIEAVRYVHKESGKNIRAFIIGDGSERTRLEEKVSALGLEKIVHFTSWEKEVERVYPGLDIVCLTSFNEGTPVSLIEAQAAGRPVVSTAVGGIGNSVLSETTALLSGVNDQDGFNANLLELVKNDKKRAEMGLAGWDFVKERFHYTRLVSDTRLLYNRLLGL
ncbi:MAG: glycosyltransferase [Bacteroidota bacterium]